MKQHIKIEQLAELMPEQFIKLDSLIFGHEKDSIEEAEYRLERIKHLIKTDKRNVAKASYIGLLKKCNIGKMIEILTKNGKTKFDYSNYPIEREYGGAGIRIYHNGVAMSFDTKELCDALWEAVKYTLEAKQWE